MPTQRPFFANFLAAFRAQTAIQQQSKGPSPTSQSSAVSATSQPSHTTSSSSTTQSTSSPSHPRSIATSTAKPPTGATTSALTQLHSPLAHSTSPLSRSPGTGPVPQSSSTARPEDRVRRGSDSSSEGFRDVMSAEKWYIGGRTAGGEERFFKLGVVRRHRSIDRLSLDRLSL